MSQQINLFAPAFRRRRIVLTASRLVVFCVLAIVGMVGFWFYEYQVVNGLKEELRNAQKLLQSQRAHVERIAAARASRKQDQSLAEEIARLEAELDVTRKQLTALKGNGTGDTHGFAEYLRAFSRQSVDGLWITGFDIRAGGEITIRGRTMNAGLVPGYIQRLDREDVLRGRSFGAFTIARPAADTVATAPGKETATRPRFLEFSLATAEPAATPGQTERAP